MIMITGNIWISYELYIIYVSYSLIINCPQYIYHIIFSRLVLCLTYDFEKVQLKFLKKFKAIVLKFRFMMCYISDIYINNYMYIKFTEVQMNDDALTFIF